MTLMEFYFIGAFCGMGAGLAYIDCKTYHVGQKFLMVTACVIFWPCLLGAMLGLLIARQEKDDE